jgi:putative transposon-encoded protein
MHYLKIGAKAPPSTSDRRERVGRGYSAVIACPDARYIRLAGPTVRYLHVPTTSMERFELNGHEVVDGDVRATGNGAHVYVPRRWLGADVKIVRVSEPNHDDE